MQKAIVIHLEPVNAVFIKYCNDTLNKFFSIWINLGIQTHQDKSTQIKIYDKPATGLLPLKVKTSGIRAIGAALMLSSRLIVARLEEVQTSLKYKRAY